jgi:hypothetical protein
MVGKTRSVLDDTGIYGESITAKTPRGPYGTSVEKAPLTPLAMPLNWGAASVQTEAPISQEAEEVGNVVIPEADLSELHQAWNGFLAELPRVVREICYNGDVTMHRVRVLSLTPDDHVLKYGFQVDMRRASDADDFYVGMETLYRVWKLDTFLRVNEEGHVEPRFTYRKNMNGKQSRPGWWLTMLFMIRID